ncbi:OprD family porin [Pseudomonas sp. SWRI100]|uniref:OprD family porin n=1 Tax=Pseudomonas TaxID=286 RepID=UPI001647ACDB|nr:MULTISPECIES: OprD family porin [Pseudomonas]MBC3495705.1 OprD family porin [Pseudomonas sp. SWRI67]MBV4526813.1 OprD family porin [Pseudomonas kermanshahensis]
MQQPSFIALAVIAYSTISIVAQASDQSESKGFIEDADVKLRLRNAYYNRDFKDSAPDAKVWGQGFVGVAQSGFTQGTVGIGADAFGILGIKLDSGRGRNYRAFFDTDSNGRPVDDLSQAGGAVKIRLSNTTIKYGDQFPLLPVLGYADNRLLPESFTGTLITSKEIDDLEVNAGHFTGDSPMGDAARDPNHLKKINLIGGTYQPSENVSFSLYHSDVQDMYKKLYTNLNVNFPLSDQQALNFDFNAYRTRYADDSAAGFALGGDGNNDRNTIWSLAAKYSFGPHAIILANQRNTGDAGYAYDFGDGGSAIYVANSYYSDFNLKNEDSWQLSYELNFAGYGVPGLFYKIAYVRGTDITTSTKTDATERELFNQISYVIQSGPAKDLSLKLRNSIYRSDNSVGPDLNEIRAFIDYPIDIF